MWYLWNTRSDIAAEGARPTRQNASKTSKAVFLSYSTNYPLSHVEH